MCIVIYGKQCNMYSLNLHFHIFASIKVCIYILFFYWHFTKRSANPCLGISRHGRADIMFCIGKRRNIYQQKN